MEAGADGHGCPKHLNQNNNPSFLSLSLSFIFQPFLFLYLIISNKQIQLFFCL